MVEVVEVVKVELKLEVVEDEHVLTQTLALSRFGNRVIMSTFVSNAGIMNDIIYLELTFL